MTALVEEGLKHRRECQPTEKNPTKTSNVESRLVQ